MTEYIKSIYEKVPCFSSIFLSIYCYIYAEIWSFIFISTIAGYLTAMELVFTEHKKNPIYSKIDSSFFSVAVKSFIFILYLHVAIRLNNQSHVFTPDHLIFGLKNLAYTLVIMILMIVLLTEISKYKEQDNE